MQSYLSLRFDSIDRRFSEIDLLIDFAIANISDIGKYQTFCRSAHVLLVSHFEGIYKEVVKDVIDDFNSITKFDEVPSMILNTHFNYFLATADNSETSKSIKDKLKDAFGSVQSKIRVEPFLFVNNKNPAPDIIHTILERFGIANFFWSIKDSDLDIVFEGLATETNSLRLKLREYLIENTMTFPYNIELAVYNPVVKTTKKQRTLWEDFLNDFLKERHAIVHGTTLTSPFNHQAIIDARIKIEIITYAIMINLCSIRPLAL